MTTKGLIITVLFLIGCSVSDVREPRTVTCHDIKQEFDVSVPYEWNEIVEEVNSPIPGGCIYTVITNYVYTEKIKGNPFPSKPADYSQILCASDACSGPVVDRLDSLSNPNGN